MPWRIKKEGNGPKPWKIVKASTGEVVGSSSSKEKAQASIRARWAGENKK